MDEQKEGFLVGVFSLETGPGTVGNGTSGWSSAKEAKTVERMGKLQELNQLGTRLQKRTTIGEGMANYTVKGYDGFEPSEKREEK